MDERTTATLYEPPLLVELGEFGEDTLGATGENCDGETSFDG
ncbi:MAG: lasso RiPP family leader peptide-containing protein [Pseudonocardiaceae bacterium]